MRKLTENEESNIYGGIAFAAFVAILTEVALSITAIVKMSTSSEGSIKTKGSSEYKWDSSVSATKNASPAFFGY